MTRITVVVARGCHLCPATQGAAEEAARILGAGLEVIDIDGVLDLERRYRARIPVVLVDDREVGAFAVTTGEILHAVEDSS